MFLQLFNFVLNKFIYNMKLVIKNTKGVYRVMDIDVRFRKDVQRIACATAKALPKGEELVEVHLNKKGK